MASFDTVSSKGVWLANVANSALLDVLNVPAAPNLATLARISAFTSSLARANALPNLTFWRPGTPVG